MKNISAFPLPEYREFSRSESAEGMPLRDYFAGQALTGLLFAFPETDFRIKEKAGRVVEEAYNIADAMLIQRGKGAYPEHEFTGEPDPTDLARDYNEAAEPGNQPTEYDP